MNWDIYCWFYVMHLSGNISKKFKSLKLLIKWVFFVLKAIKLLTFFHLNKDNYNGYSYGYNYLLIYLIT